MRWTGAKLVILLIGAMWLTARGTLDAEVPVYALTIENHRFEPTQMEIPAHTKVQLRIKNIDRTAEEFESTVLHHEKVIAGGGETTLWIGPLSPGEYGFFGDFNPATAQGRILVK